MSLVEVLQRKTGATPASSYWLNTMGPWGNETSDETENSAKQTAGRKGVGVKRSHVWPEETRTTEFVPFYVCPQTQRAVRKTYFCYPNKADFYMEAITHAQIVSSVSAAGAEHLRLPCPLSDWQSPDFGRTPSSPHCPPLPRHRSPSEKTRESQQGNLTINEQYNNVKPCSRMPPGKMYQASQSTGWTWMTVTEIGRRTAIFLEACE